MTDPRIAALADALQRMDVFGWVQDIERGADHAYYERKAAAILAALPPGWCGHSDAPYLNLVRDWAEVTDYLGLDGDSAALEVLAEIARLRKIEEAARATATLIDAVIHAPVYEQPHMPREEGGTGFISTEFATALAMLAVGTDALRAALGEKP